MGTYDCERTIKTRIVIFRGKKNSFIKERKLFVVAYDRRWCSGARINSYWKLQIYDSRISSRNCEVFVERSQYFTISQSRMYKYVFVVRNTR